MAKKSDRRVLIVEYEVISPGTINILSVERDGSTIMLETDDSHIDTFVIEHTRIDDILRLTVESV